ncbi:MAG: hypothetical protein MJY85_00800 [Fibrobacter sp.]|nr:hypothetical protein [Fibrobacter sp.]
MKALNFIAGVALGAAAAIFATKKFKKGCCCESADADAAKDCDDEVESLRGSVDSLRQELNSRIESEQTYAAKCDELKNEVAKKEAEIANLKNVCDKQAGQISKLEK